MYKVVLKIKLGALCARVCVCLAAATAFGCRWLIYVDRLGYATRSAWHGLHSIFYLGCHRHKCLFDVRRILSARF